MTPLLSALRAPATERVAVVVLTLAVALVRVRIATADGGATLFFDEAYYVENARAIAALGAYSTAQYPPLYSLLLAPVQMLPSWYSATMAVGAAASALSVPAAWFLAHSVRLRAPLIAALAVGLLPSAFAYSTFVMSENLSTPIFVLTLALSVRARRREGWLLGTGAAALVLTKYLFLPVALVLVVTYLVRRHRAEPDRPPGARRRETALVLAAPVIGAVLWLTYALGSEMTLFQAVGLTDPAATLQRSVADGEARELLLWIAVYLIALALPALPTAMLTVIYLGRRRAVGVGLDRRQRAFTATTALVAVVAVLVAVQHSFGAPYNYPEPTLAWPRYLVHLGPALIVVALLLLQTLTVGAARAVRRPLLIVTLTGAIGGALACWWFLFRGGSGIVPWGFTAPITAADLFPYRSFGTLAVALATTVVVAALLVVPIARSRAWVVGGAAIVLMLGVPTTAYIDRSIPVDSYLGDGADVGGSVIRKMIDVRSEDGVTDPTTVFFVTDGIAIERPSWQLRFWNLGPDEIQTVPLDDVELEFVDRGARGTADLLADLAALDACAAPGDACYLVTRAPLPVEGRIDSRWGQTLIFTRVG